MVAGACLRVSMMKVSISDRGVWTLPVSAF